MNYTDADRALEAIENQLCLARQLMESRRNHQAVSRQLAGCIAALEDVRLWLGRPPLKHCTAHDDYRDDCHDCYDRQYGKKRR